MKKLLLVPALFYTITLFAQQPREKLPTDSNFKVIDATIKISEEKPANFLNNVFVGENFLSSVNPDDIERIDIKKIDTVINKQKYENAIYLTTKSHYRPKPISLTELKDKYVAQNDKATVFMVDKKIISTGYDNYMVDENKLLRLIIDKIDDPAEKTSLNLIKILTKNKENLSSLAIRIRG